MNYFDAHNHLNDGLFESNFRKVAEEAAMVGVVGMVINGGDLESSRRAVEIAEQVDIGYAAVGIHPEDLYCSEQRTANSQQIDDLRLLAGSSKKIVAIGELGLDYTLATSDERRATDKQEQFELIEAQLGLADELGLPVVLHVRDVAGSEECFGDMIGLLKNFPQLTGQFHCWTGTVSQMEQALALDFYISFSGILTYGSAGHIAEVAKKVPADRILVETDGPFLIPEPRRTEMRKEGLRNHERLCLPEYVTMTTEKLAELRQEAVEIIAQQTTDNARRLFTIQTAY